MSAFSEDKDRKVIPRWRDFLTTVRLGELDPPLGQIRDHPVFDADFLERKVAAWQEHHSRVYASDLVGAAITLGREGEVHDAASFLVSRQSASTAAASRAARQLLQGDHELDEPIPEVTLLDPRSLHEQLHLLREYTNDQPRNAFLWVDMARLYEILGLPERAERAMRLALALAPNNRFVLRAASRLYVHQDDLDRAHDILRRTKVLRHDPWVLAAEIAVASAAGHTSRHVREAQRMLKGQRFSRHDLAELYSACGTLELEAGRSKQAKRSLLLSLDDPTDNALAQALWASKRLPAFHVDHRHLQTTPRPFEARTLEARGLGEWRSVLQESWKWLYDQPFSSRPAIFGSFAASVGLEDYEQSERIARVGLSANPNNFMLLNNLAFALAHGPNVGDAKDVFDGIETSRLSDQDRVVWLATKGFLQFRSGSPDAGRSHYRAAIDLAKHIKDDHRRAMALSFLALEETRAATPDASEVVRAALAACERVRLPEVQLVASKLPKPSAK